MELGRASPTLGRLIAVMMLVGLVAACGTSEPDGVAMEDGAQEVRSQPLVSAEELHRAFGPGREAPIVAAVEGGALILGGAVVEEGTVGEDGAPIRRQTRQVGDAYWVDEEGLVTNVGPLPTSDPLGDLSVSTSNGAVFVAGVTCRTGLTPSDVGELNCEPGEPELVRFRSTDLGWERIDLPGDVPPPADVVGAVAVHGFDGGVAFSVLEDREGDVRTWVTTDEQVWTEISIPERSGLCATGGALLAIDDAAVTFPADDGPVTIEPPLVPDATLSLQVRRFDAGSVSWWDVEPVEDPAVEIVRGGTIAACTAEAGYVTLNLTGDGGDALVAYLADGGVRKVDSFDGHRVAAITPTSGQVVLMHGSTGARVFAIDVTTGETRSIELPEGARVVGSVGQEFVLVVTDRLQLVDL